MTLINVIWVLFVSAFLIPTAYCAELLVQAVDSPYETGGKKGDVIVVRPDGWGWGKEENLPRYVVIKMPGVKVEDVKHYEEQLTEQVEVTPLNGGDLKGGVEEKQYTSKLVRLRKYAIPVADVESLVAIDAPVKYVQTKNIASYKSSMVVKDIAVEKVLVAEALALKEEPIKEVIDEISK